MGENGAKVCATGIIAALTAFWGLCGWLWMFWVLCLVVDYLTGTVLALRAGGWYSDIARKGIWGKLGSMLVVLVTTALDFMVGLVVNHYALPFVYTAVLSPVVLAWYTLTEVGSILENAGRLGAPLPPFLLRWIAVLQKKVDSAGARAVDGLEDGEE